MPRVISPRDLVPVRGPLDRKAVPLACNQIFGLAEIREIESIRNLYNGTSAVLNDQMSVATFKNFFLEWGKQIERDVQLDPPRSGAWRHPQEAREVLAPVHTLGESLPMPGFQG